MPIDANITLASLDALSRPSGLDRGREREIAVDAVRRLGIKTPSTYAPVATLSGGNQQKVALSRWLATKPAVLVLDEPTQGVDVGAKAEIHRLMGDLAAQGVAILMISSEMPEILGMSDRIAVMRGGTAGGRGRSRRGDPGGHPRPGPRRGVGLDADEPGPLQAGAGGGSWPGPSLLALLALVAPLVLRRRTTCAIWPSTTRRCCSWPRA